MEILWFGELINLKGFHRPDHFIYLDVLFKTNNEKVTLDNRELKEYIWAKPRKVLKIESGESYDKVIKDYINRKKS